ncbi:MAG: ATP-binding cassette domain-containing protein [Actinomycetota bacterium]
MLGVRGLRKSYGDVVALDGVDLSIAEGEICALLGPNGAGKTTLVSIVCGLRRPDAGEVTVNGIDAVERSALARRDIGFAPQELAIYPTVAVRDNLAFAGELADLRRRDLLARTEQVADALELTALLDRPVRTLSGGEKRRVHTAMAMLHGPRLLLLDEPTTGVDVATRVRLLDTVRMLAETDGTAVCYSTHYLPEVEALGASVTIIDQGRVIAQGTVPDLVSRHARTVVELTFHGPPPELRLPGSHRVEGEAVRFESQQPAVDAAMVLSSLGDRAHLLRGLEIITPSLESVFLALTGRRYTDATEALSEESSDVAVA